MERLLCSTAYIGKKRIRSPLTPFYLGILRGGYADKMKKEQPCKTVLYISTFSSLLCMHAHAHTLTRTHMQHTHSHTNTHTHTSHLPSLNVPRLHRVTNHNNREEFSQIQVYVNFQYSQFPRTIAVMWNSRWEAYCVMNH